MPLALLIKPNPDDGLLTPSWFRADAGPVATDEILVTRPARVNTDQEITSILGIISTYKIIVNGEWPSAFL